nr:hypothetical protein [uncultured Flavobacterium sp.]
MKKFFCKTICALALLSVFGCSLKNKYSAPITDNLVINDLYQKDIEIREIDAKTDTVNLEKYDKKHREQIFQFLAENKIITPNDKLKAAWILQHTAGKICEGELTSLSPENFLLAYKLSSSALMQLTLQKDTILIKKLNLPRLVALNFDRYLLFTYGYQKFGTQFIFDDKTGEMILAPINESLSNDKERKQFNVEPLDQLLKKYKIKPMPKQ